MNPLCLIIIDARGRTAAFRGTETTDWKGHLVGKNHVVAGNMLVGKSVVETMHKAFEAEVGGLAERLLKALEAGEQAGGDKRGRTSTALLVVDVRWKSETRPLLDLRVDAHHDPVKSCAGSTRSQEVICRFLNENGLGILAFNETRKVSMSFMRLVH